MGKRIGEDKATNELDIIREALEAIRESGRKMSAANRGKVEALKTRLAGLDYHPGVADAIALADELLALDVEPEAVEESRTPSFDEIRERVQVAIEAKYPVKRENGMAVEGRWIRAIYPDKAITVIDGKQVSIAYSIGVDGTVSLGDPVEVVQSFEPLKEGRIIEAVQGSKGRQWDVVLITAGKSLNNRTYPADVLRKSAPLFEGVSAYADHPEPAAAGRDRSIRDKVGRFSNVRFDTFTQDGKVTEGLRARLTVVPSWMRDMLVEAVDAGEPDFYGFSINATGKVERGRVQTIESVQSVDVVSTPAAGGRIERLVASVERSSHMEDTTVDVAAIVETKVAAAVAQITEALAPKVDEVAEIKRELAKANSRAALTEALAGASVTDISKGNIRKRFTALIEAGAEYNAEDVAAAITEASEYETALSAKFTAPPVFSTTRVEAGGSVIDAKRKRLDLMFEGTGWTKDGVKPYQSLREAYHDWTGSNPFEVNGQEFFGAFTGRYDSAKDHTRVQESLTTSTWAEVYADALYNRMITDYNLSPLHDQWRTVVAPRNILSVPDFRTQHFTLLGGYGDLTSVAEQQTYPTATTPGDDDVTWAVAKYGLIEDVTMESIVNDKIGAIAKIPRRMAEAASRTLYKFVMNMVTTDNPTLEIDSTTLYHANHSNTGTTALTLAGLAAVRSAMIQQTAYGNTSEILGFINAPKILIVPAEIEMLAKRIVNPSGTYNMSPTADTDGSVDPQAFAGMNMQVVVYPYLTDVNNWFAVADPNLMDGVMLGFFGSQTPELFIQDNPTVGGVFSADKIQYKVRHIYGGEVADFRPFYHQVVT